MDKKSRPSVLPNSHEIDRLRVLSVLTWTELAEKAGLSQQSRTKLRQGRSISIRTIRKLAEALGVEPRGLLLIDGRSEDEAA